MYTKFLCVFLLLTSYLRSDIYEIGRIDDMRPYINQNDLVLFDIDDTLITNPFSLGTPAWRSWVKTKLPSYNIDFALYDALTLHIAKHADYIPVEDTTAALISDLQQRGVAVLAFTARGRSEWYTTTLEGIDRFTHQQLNRAGIDFTQTSIPAELQRLEPAYFYEGIIFAKHIQKGDLLKHLLNDLQYHPSALVFVDDKLEQVQSVEAAAKEAGIPCIAFWYRHMEFKGASFSPYVANIQLESLLKDARYVNDHEAEEIAKTLLGIDPKEHFNAILDQHDVTRLAPIIPAAQ